MKSYIVYIIRNGATKEETEGKYIGHTDVELSEEGKEQLVQMKNELVYPPVEAVLTSPLKRCTQTASILYPDNKYLAIDSLIECNFGEFEGKDAEELKDYPMFPRWLAGEQGVEPPFGESNEAFARRVCEGFVKIIDGLIKTGTTRAAIVTHGGVLMTLLANFGLPELPMHEWITPNGCGYTLRITPSLWMRGRKLEVAYEFPYENSDEDDGGEIDFSDI